jgi:hypothetical protein
MAQRSPEALEWIRRKVWGWRRRRRGRNWRGGANRNR